MKPKPAPQPEFSLEALAPKSTPDEPKTANYLVNPAKVRRYALDLAEKERHHHFTAVSVEFIQRIDARLRNIIRDEIKRHPSRGKRLA
jgi:hypothetical protein